MSITFRALTTMADLAKVSPLEKKVWGMDPIPLHQTYTAIKNGGIAIGAFDGPELVGFVYSFPGYANGRVHLCSHMMGIDPNYRDRGIGARLKMLQAEEARKIGYATITWTYDPLETRNGYLNIVKLGGISSEYCVNCYGDMEDDFNRGLPSDRLLIEWWIQSRYLRERTALYERLAALPQGVLSSWTLRGDGLPEPARGDDRAEAALSANSPADPEGPASLLIAVPAAFQTVKERDFALAKAWRHQIREALTQGFDSGWILVNVVRPKEQPVVHYTLARRQMVAPLLENKDTASSATY